MDLMAVNIFVNREEHRIRALWRILLQGIVFVVGILLVNFLVNIIPAVILWLTGSSPLNGQSLLAVIIISRILVAIGSLLAAVFSYRIAGRWLDHRSFADFGFHFHSRWWADFAFGLFLGAILMVFIFAVERSAGWVTVTGTLHVARPDLNFWVAVAANLLFYISVGFYEEMLSRGYELRNLAEGLNFKFLTPRAALLLAYLVSSSMFGLFHLANPNSTWISTLNLIVAGLFLGLGYVLTGELALSIGLHITWNFFQGNVFGFPVSGGGTSTSFIAIQQGGPAVWTGGLFGPEAGLIGLAAIAIGSLIIVLWVCWRYGEVQLKECLAIFQNKGV
jgi:uncharacterized protein